MTTIADVEKLALESLPSVLQDDDDGLAEALTRDAALDQDPASEISMKQLDERVTGRRA